MSLTIFGRLPEKEKNPFGEEGVLVGPVGLEPTTHGLKVRCSTD